MVESEPAGGDRDIILNARVTVYLDGLIITRFTEGGIGQAGVLTTLNDHCLRILIRAKGQLGQIWPARDSSGNIPHVPYSSLKRMSALWLYVASLENSPIPSGPAEELSCDSEYTFNGLLDFVALHGEAEIKRNVLAPIKIPQGQFYMAQRTKFELRRGENAKAEERECSSLTGVAIDHRLSEKGYLILRPEPLAVSKNPGPSLLPAKIPLEPGVRYEVIIQNAPIVEISPSEHSTHFKEFYAAFPGVYEDDRYSLRLAATIDPRAYPHSPPCISPRYSMKGDFGWDPTELFPSPAPSDVDHH